MEFGVTVFLRPQVERDGCEFVDQRVGQAILREVDRLDVSMAGVAALHSHMGKLFGSVDRKFGLVFLAASRTNHAPECPFGTTESADQAAACPVALLAENSERRLAIAERAHRMVIAVDLQSSPGDDEFRVGLQEGES